MEPSAPAEVRLNPNVGPYMYTVYTPQVVQPCIVDLDCHIGHPGKAFGYDLEKSLTVGGLIHGQHYAEARLRHLIL